MRATLLSLGLLISSAAFLGCGQPCDTDHVCDLDSEGKICDGTTATTCGDGNRGQRIPCVRTPRTAVCTPTGWTFDNSGGH